MWNSNSKYEIKPKAHAYVVHTLVYQHSCRQFSHQTKTNSNGKNKREQQMNIFIRQNPPFNYTMAMKIKLSLKQIQNIYTNKLKQRTARIMYFSIWQRSQICFYYCWEFLFLFLSYCWRTARYDIIFLRNDLDRLRCCRKCVLSCLCGYIGV